MAHTLRGRIQILRGDVAEARHVAEKLHASLASAKVNDPDACMKRDDDIFSHIGRAVLEPERRLSLGKLLDEANARAASPYEIVEPLEGRARNAARRNDFAHAERILVEALDLAQKSAAAVADRVVRGLRDLQRVHSGSEKAS